MTNIIIKHNVGKTIRKNGSPMDVSNKHEAAKIATDMFTNNQIPNLPKRKLNQYVQSWSAQDAGDHWAVVMQIADR